VETTFLALGSNLGCREANVLRALRHLDSGGLTLLAVSSLYESVPAEGVDGGDFINAVAKVRSLLCPDDLLNRLQTIEKLMGRSGDHNRPREIDIDILSFGNVVMRSPDLALPHPRYAKRAFVLVPLREVAPDFLCPLSGRGVDELVATLGPVRITQVSRRSIVTASL
jgi:2-amino-4-hydroxy-6-hydroxymethyldihydropteridine diphosphokinase